MLTVILIWRFSDRAKVAKLTYAIINPIYYKHGFSPCSAEIAKLKSCQQCFLSKPPNIMLAFISAYMVDSDIVVVIYFSQRDLDYKNNYKFL